MNLVEDVIYEAFSDSLYYVIKSDKNGGWIMNYVELSIKETELRSNELAKKVSKQFKPDIVIFIAKGSFIIGEEVANFFKIPLIEIHASRKANKMKEIISPLLKIIPKRIKIYLRKKELNSGMHNKDLNRNVYIEDASMTLLMNAKNILIVDDSVDTGHTAKQVYRYVTQLSTEKIVKFASLNSFKESTKVFSVHWNIYTDYMMNGPWSKDSKEYNIFLKRYNQWKKN